MINVICSLVTKYSISLYILRIQNSRAVRWILAWLMLFMTLATIGVVVILAVSCIPLERLWNKGVPGICLPQTSVYSVSYVHSGFTIVIDLCLTSAPVIILWHVRITRGRKTLICGLMSLGLVATVSNGLRNCFQSGLTAPDMPCTLFFFFFSFLYFLLSFLPLYPFCQCTRIYNPLTKIGEIDAITNVSIVSILEVGTGVIAACIPACVPAFGCQQKAKPATPSYRDKPISVIRGDDWGESPFNWAWGNTTSETVALCGVKAPARVATKVTAAC